MTFKVSFKTLCGGERGICLLRKPSIKSILHKVYYLSDTSTDTSLFGYNYLKFKVVKYKYNYLNIKESRLKNELVILEYINLQWFKIGLRFHPYFNQKSSERLVHILILHTNKTHRSLRTHFRAS